MKEVEYATSIVQWLRPPGSVPYRILRDRRLQQRLSMLSISCLLWFFAAAAQGQAIPEIAQTDQTLTIPLPEWVAYSDSDTLAVELDGYDISAFATFDDRLIRINLDFDLQAGDHRVVVLAFRESGDIETWVDSSLHVQQGEAPLDWNVHATLSTDYRLYDKPSDRFASDDQRISDLSVSASANKSWSRLAWSSEIDLNYTDRPGLGAFQDDWQLPHYRSEITYQNKTLQNQLEVGHIDLQREDLLFSGFKRRGLANRVKRANQPDELTLFVMQSDVNTSSKRSLLLDDSSNQIQGATFGFSLLDSRLQLGGGFVDGEGAKQVGVDDSPSYGGTGWNLFTDSQFLDNSIWLHLEYAESRFDSDGIDLGEEAKQDDAKQAVLAFSSEGALPALYFDSWYMHARYQQIGKDYYTLGNLSLPGDMQKHDYLLSLTKGSAAIEMTVSDQFNNLDKDPALARQDQLQTSLSLDYQLATSQSAAVIWDYLGVPSTRMAWYSTRVKQDREKSIQLGFDVNRRVQEHQLGLNFSKQTVNWGIQFQQLEQDERSQQIEQGGVVLFTPMSDTESDMMSLSLAWNPLQTLGFSASAQHGVNEQLESGDTFYSRNYQLSSYAYFMQQQLGLNTSLNYSENYSELNDIALLENDFQQQLVNVQVSWTEPDYLVRDLQAQWVLTTSYGRSEDRIADVVDEQWAALLSLKLSWQAGATY